MAHTQRHGYSLIEVLLAMSILVGSLIAIGRVVSVGKMHLDRDRDLSAAQLLADSRMNEIASGAVPLMATTWTRFVRAPEWSYAIEITDSPWVELVTVQVLVGRCAPPGDSSLGPLDATPTGPPYVLARWMPASLQQDQRLEESGEPDSSSFDGNAAGEAAYE